jgi:delta 1-pyrroline-5-carboxylate dehydrogenase
VVKIKRKKKEPVSFNKTEMENAQLEFYRLKEQKKLLDKREDELKKRLSEYMERAISPDSNGHYTFTTLNEKGEKVHLQRQARKKVVLNPERAIDYLASNGYEDAIVGDEVIASDVTQMQVLDVLAQHAPHLLEKVTKPDEVAVEQLVTSGTIPFSDFEQLCDITTTYAMSFVADKNLGKTGEEIATERKRKKV